MSDNPYVGPRAFERGETLFGRDREAGHLRDLLIAERIVLLHSPSGAGKTSLIQAALIPRLETARFAVQSIVRVGLEPPPELRSAAVDLNRYVTSVRLSLDPGKETSLDSTDLTTYLASRQPPDASRRRSELLIFDQFEEILTVDPTDYPAKMEFFRQVGEALLDPHRWALFAVRDEFVAGLEGFERAIPTRLATTYRLDLLSTAAAAEAIRGPAARARVEVTPEALELLLRDLARVRFRGADGRMSERSGRYVEPVQLQVVCRRLWTRLPAGAVTIDEAAVSALGSLDDALAAFYDDEVARVSRVTGIGQRRIRDWFEHQLITPQGIRGQVLVDSGAAGLDPRAVSALDDAHLIRLEQRRGAAWAELAHDRLIHPILTDNARWRQVHLSPLELQSPVWVSQHQPASLLLSGKALREAEAWASSHAADLEPDDRAYLQASLDARRERRARVLRLILFALLGVAVLAMVVVSLASAGDSVRTRMRADEQVAAAEATVSAASTRTTELEARVAEANVQLTVAVATQAALMTALQDGDVSSGDAQARLAQADARVETSRANATFYASRLASASAELGQASTAVAVASSTARAASTAISQNPLSGLPVVANAGSPAGPGSAVTGPGATSTPLTVALEPTPDVEGTAVALADLNVREADRRVLAANTAADAAEQAAATRVAQASIAEANAQAAISAASTAAASARASAPAATATGVSLLPSVTPSFGPTGTVPPSPSPAGSETPTATPGPSGSEMPTPGPLGSDTPVLPPADAGLPGLTVTPTSSPGPMIGPTVVLVPTPSPTSAAPLARSTASPPSQSGPTPGPATPSPSTTP